MDNNLNLRNLLLAGIGSIAYSLEKGMDMIDDLVKKGELTVSQGKELNQELKNRFSQSGKDPNQTIIKEIMTSLNLATKEDFHNLEARVSKLEQQLP
ncbi:MAG TPA: hypothetical protein DEA85_05770 [Firmicutes bacterium]|jgi:polyhydroxyalkanoate synthesis regulator phasin|nr:hypothetical protein [Bacillota bacterium]HBS93509.1 hypothetical protein [Bacillota bacterium]